MTSHLSDRKGGNIYNDFHTSSFDNRKKIDNGKQQFVDGTLGQTKSQIGNNNNIKSIANISSFVINC